MAVAATLAACAFNPVGAETVPPAYQAIARETGVPAPLLYAVALTESGQSRLSQNQLRPWPWTLNVAGQGHFFPSRKAAWRALTQALDAENTVDIGLMQVNWGYHQSALGSPWQALDPYHNLRVGAGILRDCQLRGSDWWASLGCYHAPNDPVRAKNYRERVEKHWQQVTKAPGRPESHDR